MIYKVDIVDVAPTVLAAVRTRTTLQNLGKTIGESLNAVYAFLASASVRHEGHNVVVYRDNLMKPEGGSVEIGVQVSNTFESGSTVVCSFTPSGKAAKATHIGPYSNLPHAHKAIREWCADNKKKLAGPDWEVYGDWHEDPQQLRTNVYYLLL